MEISFPPDYCPISGLVKYLWGVLEGRRSFKSVLRWVEEIHETFGLEPSLAFVAHYYARCYITFMKRQLEMDTITLEMMQELIVLSLMIASKAYHDHPRSNFAWVRAFPDMFCRGAEEMDNENIDPDSQKTYQERYRLETLNSSEFSMFHYVLDHQVVMSEEMIEEMMILI